MCLSRSGTRSMSGLRPRVDNERRDGIDELHLQQFHRGHLGHEQPPGITLAQINLLQILVQFALGKQIFLRRQFIRQQRHLRERRRMSKADLLEFKL